MNIFRRAIALCLLTLTGTTQIPAYARADLAWHDTRTSSAIHRKSYEVPTDYSPGAAGTDVPPGSTITRVAVNLTGPSSAQVNTRLCWNGSRCIVVNATHMDTDAFAGLDASRPFTLWHSVPGRGPIINPIYVPASVTVWYQPSVPPAR
ncbi:MAG: flagellar protein FlhE [Corticimicrobacter sp.]|uniref:flagellar protein FlhE n=1 Tax=Corticimicrobacter sp. TaxID=2678536 RepID=UPI0032DAF6DA